MIKMIKMVVFDMAGTTVNENNVVYKTLRKAINEKGYDLSLEQVLKEGAGKEKLQAIKSILTEYLQINDNELANDIYRNFIVRLGKAYDTIDIFPQDNAIELFHELKSRNILVILNTGYNNETAETLINKLGWKNGVDYDGLVTATDVQNNRPKPDMILLAMKQFHIHEANEVVKVGDSTIDIEEGEQAGCKMNIGITTGAHTREQLRSANPDHIIDNLIELLPLLDE
jgi:phosphonatase-like hydrolase